jgi:hypothetical protein
MANLHAVQLEPENLQYRMNSANVLAESQQIDAAIGVLKAALPLAKRDGEKQMVTAQLAALESYRDSMKRMEPTAPPPTTVSTTQSVATSAKGSTVTIEVEDTSSKGPEYPSGEPSGARHTVSGVLRGVKCSYPSILTLDVDNGGKLVALYANNFFKIEFTTLNYQPKGAILPCTGIEGMKAKVVYGEVTDPRVAGQIVAIELRQ